MSDGFNGMRIAIIGYGKMGQLIDHLATRRGHSVLCIIDENKYPLFAKDKDKARLFGQFGDDNFVQCDVAFEFTAPAFAQKNITECWKYDIPVICGTTGWDDSYLRKKDEEHVAQGKKTRLVHKMNFSIGINMMLETCSLLAPKIEESGNYKVSITEVHHTHKIDSPSGTALLLADALGNKNIPISSIRQGEEVGTHSIKWESENDIIEITHIAKNRECFALGAIVEAENLLKA